jgi:large subunit ribosomal protein L20
LWIQRINAAVRGFGLTYSEFINGLKLSNVSLDRKVMAEMAVNEPSSFGALIKTAKDALAEKVAVAS